MDDGSQSSITSLVTSSAKIGLKACSFALAFPVRLLTGSQTSQSTAGAEADTPVEWADWPETRAARAEEDEPGDFRAAEGELDEPVLGITGNGMSVAQEDPVPYVPAAEEDALVPDEPVREEPAPEAEEVLHHMEIRFARLRDEAKIPTRAHEGDAGMDLYAADAA